MLQVAVNFPGEIAQVSCILFVSSSAYRSFNAVLHCRNIALWSSLQHEEICLFQKIYSVVYIHCQ